MISSRDFFQFFVLLSAWPHISHLHIFNWQLSSGRVLVPPLRLQIIATTPNLVVDRVCEFWHFVLARSRSVMVKLFTTNHNYEYVVVLVVVGGMI